MPGLIARILRPYSTISQTGTTFSSRNYLEVRGPTITDDAANDRTILDFTTLLAGVITPAALAIGPSYQTSYRTGTVGPSTSTLVAVPMAANSYAELDFVIVATDRTYVLEATSTRPYGFTTIGSPSEQGPSPSSVSQFPIAPTFAIVWASGALSINVKGPTAPVIGSADNGSGQLRLTLGANVSSAITGMGVTLSGLTGTPLANGAHTGGNVARVDATHVDILDAAWVANDTVGAMIETAPRTIYWSTTIAITVAP